MAASTTISWCDHTANFWTGCTKVSDIACAWCYAEFDNDHRFGRVTWGPHGDRRQFAGRLKGPPAWERAAVANGTRPFVFCQSYSDTFDNHKSILPAWRTEVWEIIEATPHLVWLLLTKRPQNILKMMPDGLKNVALGCTVVTQEEFDRDVPFLLRAAEKRDGLFTFASLEPLAERIHLIENGHELDWVIVGGLNGRGHPSEEWRAMDPAWARDIKDQCRRMEAVFHFKQMGSPSGHGEPTLDGQFYNDRPVV